MTEPTEEQIEAARHAAYMLDGEGIGRAQTIAALKAAGVVPLAPEPPRSERQILAALSFAAGRYIECDERPRTPELWTALCEAQGEAAAFLNTAAAPVSLPAPPSDAITDEELDKIEQFCEGMPPPEPPPNALVLALVAEVRRLRAALREYDAAEAERETGGGE